MTSRQAIARRIICLRFSEPYLTHPPTQRIPIQGAGDFACALTAQGVRRVLPGAHQEPVCGRWIPVSRWPPASEPQSYFDSGATTEVWYW
jgi:hypothetical protein